MSDIHAGYGHGLRDSVDDATDSALAQIRGALHGLRSGSVTIVIQNGVVIQIDRTEERQLQPNARRPETLAMLGAEV